MIGKVKATFTDKVTAHQAAITRILSLVEEAGGEISTIGLEGDELELTVWVQFHSELSVEWSEKRGWILEIRHRVRRQPDPVAITKELRYLLSGVPRGRVVFNDPVLKDAVDKVYSSAQEV